MRMSCTGMSRSRRTEVRRLVVRWRRPLCKGGGGTLTQHKDVERASVECALTYTDCGVLHKVTKSKVR